MKLTKPIKLMRDGKEVEINEIDIKKEDFTAKILMDSEKEFLISGGIFPAGSMEASRSYLGVIAAKIIGCRFEDLEEMDGTDFLRMTDTVRGFFGNSGLEMLMKTISESLS